MHSGNTIGAGKSSYDLIDAPLFWRTLPLREGMTVLDLGCGQGRYSLALAGRVGPSGKVIAVDAWSEGITRLKEEAERARVEVIEAVVADAGARLPIADRQVDLCLLGTVLHDFVAEGIGPDVLAEIKRVLKPEGVVAVVEFKKIDGPPGPPREVRMAVEDVSVLLQRFGLIRFSAVIELGPYVYAAHFRGLKQAA